MNYLITIILTLIISLVKTFAKHTISATERAKIKSSFIAGAPEGSF